MIVFVIGVDPRQRPVLPGSRIDRYLPITPILDALSKIADFAPTAQPTVPSGLKVRPECSQTNSLGCQDKGQHFFFAKKTKNSYLVSSKLPQHPTQRAKVFWFFFSKKNAFFASALFWLPYFSDGHSDVLKYS